MRTLGLGVSFPNDPRMCGVFGARPEFRCKYPQGTVVVDGPNPGSLVRIVVGEMDEGDLCSLLLALPMKQPLLPDDSIHDCSYSTMLCSQLPTPTSLLLLSAPAPSPPGAAAGSGVA